MDPNVNITPQNPMKKEDTYYEATMRWIEDTYLKYFGQNRTSYGIKGKQPVFTCFILVNILARWEIS